MIHEQCNVALVVFIYIYKKKVELSYELRETRSQFNYLTGLVASVAGIKLAGKGTCNHLSAVCTGQAIIMQNVHVYVYTYIHFGAPQLALEAGSSNQFYECRRNEVFRRCFVAPQVAADAESSLQ